MTNATPRFSLPMLAVAQAQKEVTHNEALVLIDALLHATVEAGPQTSPQPSASAGQCWLVGDGAMGAWTGQDGAMAVWTVGGWRFAAPREGMQVRRAADSAVLRYRDGLWVEPNMITIAEGGSTIDAEVRIALAALISALTTQGLVISG